MSSRLTEAARTTGTVRTILEMSARRPHGSLIVALLMLLIPVVAGCGSSGTVSSGSDLGRDPATVAPPTAVLYGQAILRPEGDMKDGVEAAARKVLHVEDPAAELRRLLDRASSHRALFSRDVEPWLGTRAGGFLLLPASGAGDPDWGLAFAIDDDDAYRAAEARGRRSGDAQPAGSYRGVTYCQGTSDRNEYAARVGDFYVDGTLRGLRAAIDASKGTSLADASRFTDATDGVPDDALAFGYVDPKAIASALAHDPSASAAARQALARFADAPVVASLTATADELAIEASGASQLASSAGAASDATVSAGQLPGDSWLALATPPLGPLVRAVIASAGVHEEAARTVRAFGLDLDRDLLDRLGALGVFVRGSGVLDIGGGALLQMTDAAAAQQLVTRIEAVAGTLSGISTHSLELGGARGFELRIPQSPQPIVVLAKGDRVAAGYAASSAQDLLDPQQRFDQSSAGKAAIATLGDGYRPAFVLLVPPLAGLLRSLDQLQVADLSSVLPYVNAYRSLALGTKLDGDRTSVRIVAALR
jgi:hypothetical protein